VLDGIPDGAYVYFVHSYIVTTRERDDVVATTSYGVEFPAVGVRDRLVGLQFHPEKSGRIGLRIIRNIVGWVAARSPRSGAGAP
jgi:glutamine amidotransferase